MKTFQAYFGRLTAMSLLFTAFLLAACGGGGSGGTTVPPPTPTPVAGNLTIKVDPTDGATGVARDAKIVLTYASSTGTYASSTGTLSCNGTSSTLAQATDQVAKKVTFTPAAVLPYGSTCAAQGTSTATGLDGGASTTVSWKTTFTTEQLVCKTGESLSADGQTCIPVACPTGTTLTGGICVANALRYTDLLISYWGQTRGWPQKTMGDGSQVVAKNKTTYSDFLNCQPATKPLADGTIPHACAPLFGTGRYMDIVLDPISMELKNSSSVPTGLTYVPLTYDTAYVLASKPTWTTSSQFSTGDYVFVDQTSKNVMRKLSASGVESVIHAGDMTKFEVCNRVMVFSNP